ncbi:ABC transporter ATP-binding protein [Streptomyces sp. CMB-StM0423]|uniref:ABC transporter ATP-binding protein n=1 Tax=Streptomyces sp. CMB-StM0423 TaxID=2059884 RepID=UPI000C7117B1|nr:ABC transporter ATP-binding protein [Streptomyces sp. CMB-StM0423]AUH42196.1 ABC transporter ATP-binding protein [Streptomyces sp. CMB-StM0423]
MTALEITGLHKNYVDAYSGEEVTAIGDVSFSVNEGEFVSVLGPSGCGKTTVLNIVAGFVNLTEGSVVVDGQEVGGPGPDRGVVFQSHALFPWKTVLGNVVFGLRMKGVPRAERDAKGKDFLELVGLGGFEHKYPHELSGGMQQRLGVARVLANEPAVMLMDEPFASIDAQTRRKLQEDLTRIFEKRHPTVFFVTHDVDEAVFLSDRVVVLSKRPSRVREIVTVDLPRPREWRTALEMPEFREIANRVNELLVDDGGAAAGGATDDAGGAADGDGTAVAGV